MEEKSKDKWYYGVTVVVVALLCFGPLALPLLILSPKFSKMWKIIIFVLVIAATVWFVAFSAQVFSDFMKRLDEVKQLYVVK